MSVRMECLTFRPRYNYLLPDYRLVTLSIRVYTNEILAFRRTHRQLFQSSVKIRVKEGKGKKES